MNENKWHRLTGIKLPQASSDCGLEGAAKRSSRSNVTCVKGTITTIHQYSFLPSSSQTNCMQHSHHGLLPKSVSNPLSRLHSKYHLPNSPAATASRTTPRSKTITTPIIHLFKIRYRLCNSRNLASIESLSNSPSPSFRTNLSLSIPPSYSSPSSPTLRNPPKLVNRSRNRVIIIEEIQSRDVSACIQSRIKNREVRRNQLHDQRKYIHTAHYIMIPPDTITRPCRSQRQAQLVWNSSRCKPVSFLKDLKQRFFSALCNYQMAGNTSDDNSSPTHGLCRKKTLAIMV